MSLPNTESTRSSIKKTMRLYGTWVQNWGVPTLLSLLINLAAFGLMPNLLGKTNGGKLLADENFEAIQVIRMARPESEVKKNEPREVPKPEKKEIQPLKDMATAPPLQKKFEVPFELNPRLPAGPQTLSLPALELLSLKGTANNVIAAYQMNQIDAPITPIAKIPPMYPLRAKRLGIEGAVTVRFIVNEEGLISNITIIKAEPSDMFENSVNSCVSRWRFKPGTIEGVPVKTIVETTIRFELEE